MSGFILNRGKSFAARYKEFESKGSGAEYEDKSFTQKVTSVKKKVIEIKSESIVTKAEPFCDDNEIDVILSRPSYKPRSDTIGNFATVGMEVKRERPKKDKKSKNGKKVGSKRQMVTTLDSSDSDVDYENIVMGKKDSDCDTANFSDDSNDPDLEITEGPSSGKQPDTLTIKLKFDGRINKFNVDYNERLLKNLNAFYKALEVSKKSHQLVLTHNDEIILFHDTPRSLNLSILDILEAYARERSDSDETSKKRPHKEKKDPNLLEVRLRCNQDGKHDQPVVLTIAKDGTLDKIMNEYAISKNYNLEDLIFEFDGERLLGKETPNALEMEDGSLIDVRMKSKK